MKPIRTQHTRSDTRLECKRDISISNKRRWKNANAPMNYSLYANTALRENTDLVPSVRQSFAVIRALN